MEAPLCSYCQKSFTPNKYSPSQKICSDVLCQKKRQLDSMKTWREKNPNYFKYDESKGVNWIETQRKRSRLWRQSNPEKIKSYRQSHLDEYRAYMREYMRQYREKKKPAAPPQGPVSSETPIQP